MIGDGGGMGGKKEGKGQSSNWPSDFLCPQALHDQALVKQATRTFQTFLSGSLCGRYAVADSAVLPIQWLRRFSGC
jgi:hypothetical protein